MKKEHDDLLVSKYPKIFVHRNGDRRQHRIATGFECGDGWFKLLDRLCHNIQHHIDSTGEHRKWAIQFNSDVFDALAGNYLPLEVRWPTYSREQIDRAIKESDVLTRANDEVKQVEATLIKEKFGGLRFHATGGDSYISGVVDMAQSMSYSICDICGQTGKVGNQSLKYDDDPKDHNTGGYYATRCREHWGYREEV